MLIDTHCHLHDLEFFTPAQQSEFLANAREKGVQKIICIGTNPEDSLRARDFAAQNEGVYWTYGIHPEFANNYIDREAVIPLEGAEISPTLVAIGEVGLDYHYTGYDRTAQIKLFEQMLQLARDRDLPVSLHIREAFDDALSMIDNFPETRGVVHSFTGSKRVLKSILERGLYIGVNGLVTYTTPPIPPLERILLETDAPFLTPVPFRDTINQPGYVAEIAAYLAEKLGIKQQAIWEQTTNNAQQVFQI